MSTRRSRSSNRGESVKNFGDAVARVTSPAYAAYKASPAVKNTVDKGISKVKSGTKKVLGGYLRGTQKAADAVMKVMPQKMKSRKPSMRARGGLRRRKED